MLESSLNRCKGNDSFVLQKLSYLNCGISSVVERNLAKVDVVGSNPIFRSRPYSEVVITIPCHGIITGSNPVRVVGSSNSHVILKVAS